VPETRTPRELLLAALERRHLTGFRASPDAAWVVFPPAQEGGAVLEVIHLPRANRFRVVSSQAAGQSGISATTLGNFRTGDDAAACIEDALLSNGNHTTRHWNSAALN